MDARYEHSVDRLQHRWHLPTLPRGPAFHDMAGQSRQLRAVQYTPREGNGGNACTRRHLTRARTCHPMRMSIKLILTIPQFFAYVGCGYFVWNFVPTYLFTALSGFAWVTWIKPNNLKVSYKVIPE